VTCSCPLGGAPLLRLIICRRRPAGGPARRLRCAAPQAFETLREEGLSGERASAMLAYARLVVCDGGRLDLAAFKLLCRGPLGVM